MKIAKKMVKAGCGISFVRVGMEKRIKLIFSFQSYFSASFLPMNTENYEAFWMEIVVLAQKLQESG